MYGVRAATGVSRVGGGTRARCRTSLTSPPLLASSPLLNPGVSLDVNSSVISATGLGVISTTGAAFSTEAEPLVVLDRGEDGVATIKLNAPKRLNALTADMGDEFMETIDHLRVNCDGLRAVVLTGEGRAFSAGGDMKFLRARCEDTPSRNSVIMRKFYERFLYVRMLPVPVVAAINGPAIGAGMCLALACDYRIASPDAVMGFTFAKLGLHPGMGASHFLPQVVGPMHAARLLLTGEVIKGEEARDMGLVELADKEEVVDTAYALARKIGAAGPIAVRTATRSLRLRQEEGLDRALWREADSQAQCYASEEMIEGLDAIANSREPAFGVSEDFRE